MFVYKYNDYFSCRKIFLFLQKVVSPITPINPELAYSLYLQIASLASSFALPSISTDFNTIAYEFLVQAFSVYGDDISESKAQIRSMTAMVGTLSSCRGFSPTEFGALVAKTAQFSARLLKKPDQCKMVTLCSHLFYTGDDNVRNIWCDAHLNYLYFMILFLTRHFKSILSKFLRSNRTLMLIVIHNGCSNVSNAH